MSYRRSSTDLLFVHSFPNEVIFTRESHESVGLHKNITPKHDTTHKNMIHMISFVAIQNSVLT